MVQSMVQPMVHTWTHTVREVIRRVGKRWPSDRAKEGSVPTSLYRPASWHAKVVMAGVVLLVACGSRGGDE